MPLSARAVLSKKIAIFVCIFIIIYEDYIFHAYVMWVELSMKNVYNLRASLSM